MGGETKTPAGRPGLKASTKKRDKDSKSPKPRKRILAEVLPCDGVLIEDVGMTRKHEWVAAFASDRGPASFTTRHLLHALTKWMQAEHSAIGWNIFPSTRTIAEAMAVSQRVVCEHLDIAVKTGWLQKEERSRYKMGKKDLIAYEYLPCVPSAYLRSAGGDVPETLQDRPAYLGSDSAYLESTSAYLNADERLPKVSRIENKNKSVNKPKNKGADAPSFFGEENDNNPPPTSHVLQDEKAEGFSNERTLTDSDLASEPWVTAVTLLSRLDRVSHTEARYRVRCWVGEYGKPHVAELIGKAPKGNNPRRFHDFIIDEFNATVRVRGVA